MPCHTCGRYQYRHVRAEQEAKRKGSMQYFLAANIVVEHHEAIDYYDYINVLMQALVLKFDTPFLNEVLQLVSEASSCFGGVLWWFLAVLVGSAGLFGRVVGWGACLPACSS